MALYKKSRLFVALNSLLAVSIFFAMTNPVLAAKPQTPPGQLKKTESSTTTQTAPSNETIPSTSGESASSESGSTVEVTFTPSPKHDSEQNAETTSTENTSPTSSTSSTTTETATTQTSTTTTSPTTSPQTKPAKPTVGQTNPISQSNSLQATDCNQTEWHWIINQLRGRTAPASITGYFQDAGQVVVPLDTKQSSKDVAHYTLTTHLGDRLEAPGATTTLENVSTWTGRFNLSHGPCTVPLEVSKTADTSFTRTWSWDIHKTADVTNLGTIDLGQSATVNYTVTVNAASQDSDWTVSGTITIVNPASNPAATIESVADVLSDFGSVSNVDCGVTFPHVLSTGSTLECDYTQALTGAVNQTNTATVTTTGEVPGDTATANVAFSTNPDEEIDECVDVTDDNVGQGSLGTVCANDAPGVFTYSLVFGNDAPAEVVVDVELECGESDHVNTASFITNDTNTTDSDSATVTFSVVCRDFGCTLTQGYWKTHSEFGPASANATWDLMGGPNTTFFLSGQTWYEVFWTEPAGNAYYILAHQYMAARLNQLNGASTPSDVQNALDDATGLFNAYTPAQAAALTGDDHQAFIDLAGLLASYNEGAVGPGHCD